MGTRILRQFSGALIGENTRFFTFCNYGRDMIGIEIAIRNFMFERSLTKKKEEQYPRSGSTQQEILESYVEDSCSIAPTERELRRCGYTIIDEIYEAEDPNLENLLRIHSSKEDKLEFFTYKNPDSKKEVEFCFFKSGGRYNFARIIISEYGTKIPKKPYYHNIRPERFEALIYKLTL